LKIDSLVVIPTLLVILWAVLAAGTIATLGRMPFTVKAPVQQRPLAEEIVVHAEPKAAPVEITAAPLR
jgi:hypothetical protein